jgi:hypothetical protein
MDLPNKSEPPVPKKNIKPVISGASKTSRPATRRFFDFLFAESPKALVSKIGRDVLVPRAKAGVEEALNSFVHGMFWGQGSAPISTMVRGTVLRGGATNYNQISSGPPSALSQAREANQARSSGNYQDVVCPTQQSAEILLANMYELFNQYHVVAVGDLYEAAGITPSISDSAYGWTSLDGARITKSRDGYVLELPRPTLI